MTTPPTLTITSTPGEGYDYAGLHFGTLRAALNAAAYDLWERPTYADTSWLFARLAGRPQASLRVNGTKVEVRDA